MNDIIDLNGTTLRRSDIESIGPVSTTGSAQGLAEQFTVRTRSGNEFIISAKNADNLRAYHFRLLELVFPLPPQTSDAAKWVHSRGEVQSDRNPWGGHEGGI